MITEVTVDFLNSPKANPLVEMGELFYRESRLPGKFIPEVFKTNWSKILKLNLGAMWIAQMNGIITGAIGGLAHPDIYDNTVVAQEAFWFMHPDHRYGFDAIKLYTTFESWAMSIGAGRIVMSNTFNNSSEQTRKFYVKNGFLPVDVSYHKTL